MNLPRVRIRALVAVATIFVASAAHAVPLTLTVTPGIDNSGTANVVFNPCDSPLPILGPAPTVAGCVNTDHALEVSFTSDEDIESNGGQAKIDATDSDGYSYLKISIPSETFDKLVLNIDSLQDGRVSFLDGVHESGGWALDANGQNFFTITGGPFDFIEFRTFNAAGTEIDMVVNTQQIRIGGREIPLPPTSVPEPGSLLLMGLALAALATARRRHRRS